MPYRFRLTGLGLVLVMLLLSACNFPNPTAEKPTSTPVPTAAPISPTPESQVQDNTAQCVAGTWEMQDMISFLNTNLPRELLQGQDVTFTGSSGHLRYTFAPGGQVTAAAENFQVNATAKVGPLSLDAVADIKGSSSASYTVNEANRTIEVTNLSDHGFTLSASIAGNQILPETPIDSLIWFGLGRNSAASMNYTCAGNQLSFTFSLSGASASPQTVNLTRLAPLSNKTIDPVPIPGKEKGM